MCPCSSYRCVKFGGLSARDPAPLAGFESLAAPPSIVLFSEMAAAEPKDVTQDESRQLRRVFDYLCDYASKSRLEKQRQPKLDRKSKILAYKKNPEAVKIVDDSGRELSAEQIDTELRRIDDECAEISERIDAIDRKPNKKIRGRDLMEALARLGKKATLVREHPVIARSHRGSLL